MELITKITLKGYDSIVHTQEFTENQQGLGGVNRAKRMARGVHNRKRIDNQVSNYVDRSIQSDFTKALKVAKYKKRSKKKRRVFV